MVVHRSHVLDYQRSLHRCEPAMFRLDDERNDNHLEYQHSDQKEEEAPFFRSHPFNHDEVFFSFFIELAEKSVLVWCFLRDGSSCVTLEEVGDLREVV